MELSQLIASAGTLLPPSEAAATEFKDKRTVIASLVSQLLSDRKDIEGLVGPDNIELMKDNCHNFTDFMYSQFCSYSPETLAQTVFWAMRAYRSRGFEVAFWPVELRTFLTAIDKELTPESLAEIRPFYEWVLVNLPAATESSDEALASSSV